MNKREAEKAARVITWRACMLHDDVCDELARMRSEGYTMRREQVAGFDGFILSRRGASDLEAQYIAAPRKRKPGKKQTCTAYRLLDVRAFSEACEALAAGDYARADSIAAGVHSPALLAELREGLAHLYAGMGGAAVSDQVDAYEASELEQVRAVLGNPADVDVSQKRAGCCIWVSGNTKPHRDILKALGFRWAPKKSAWYWKPCAA